ncbi:MAG: hypothetical protein ACYDBB_16275 [Armatimonadota bacterium]
MQMSQGNNTSVRCPHCGTNNQLSEGMSLEIAFCGHCSQPLKAANINITEPVACTRTRVAGCNFQRIRDNLASSTSNGHHVYFKKGPITEFLNNPCEDTAIKMIDFFPESINFFQTDIVDTSQDIIHNICNSLSVIRETWYNAVAGYLINKGLVTTNDIPIVSRGTELDLIAFELSLTLNLVQYLEYPPTVNTEVFTSFYTSLLLSSTVFDNNDEMTKLHIRVKEYSNKSKTNDECLGTPYFNTMTQLEFLQDKMLLLELKDMLFFDVYVKGLSYEILLQTARCFGDKQTALYYTYQTV